MSQEIQQHSDSDASVQFREDKPDDSAKPSRKSGQLTLTQQPPLSSLVTLEADTTAHRLWVEIANTEAFWHGFADALTSLDIDRSHQHHHETVLKEEYGVTAMGGIYAAMLTSRCHPNDQLWDVLQLHEQFGASGRSRAGWHLPLDELRDGPLAVLRASEWTPTISIQIDDRFEELRTEQQNDVIWLIAELAQAVDLRIVATGRWRRKLARNYREQLPGVSEQCSAGPTVGAIAETVEQARRALDPDGRKVRILRQLAAETSETLSYHELFVLHNVTDGAVRQCLTTSDPSLTDLGLVETFPRSGGRGNAVELLAAGREFLETLDEEIGRQQRIDAVVSESGNSSVDSRVNPPAHEAPHSPGAEVEAEAVAERGGCGSSGGGGVSDDRDSDRHRLPHHHQVRSAARHRYAAAAGSAIEGGITLVDQPLPVKDDRGEPHWYYDHENDCLLVGAEYDNPMKGWVCIALALANPRTFHHILTPERFEAGKLGDMLSNHVDLLRNSRCLGYLKDADATAEDYTEALLDAAEDLRDLTKDWYHGNYENPKQFRATILREAHGLAGTMAHLLDLADVDLVREFRLPKFIRDSDESNRHDFVETIATGASIQSRYREFAAYRQLFEEREDKRKSAIPPRVDADDPFGELIGSFVLVGKSITSLADPLRRRLSDQEVHDDAPEFAVEVPVEVGDDRQYTAQTVQLMCSQKSIRPTREATSMLAALAGTPYDAAKALHNLGSETKAPGRSIRLDEVRFALSTLDAKRILPEMSKPTLSKVVHALLVAETPLVQGKLADRADVSARSIRTHTDRLAAFDFVRKTDSGWRFTLSLRGDGEHDGRDEDILPWFVAAAGDDEQEQTTFVRDIIAEVVYDLLDSNRYANPADPVGGALFEPPGERISALREVWEWLDPWISVVEVLLDADDGVHTENAPPLERTTAMVGEQPDQASLAAVAAGGGG